MKILVINSGSSSIKYSLFDMHDLHMLASGVIERIGESRSKHQFHLTKPDGLMQKTIVEQKVSDHRHGLDEILQVMKKSGALEDAADLDGIGHRVVHGGELFHKSTLIDDKVLNEIRSMIPLAPLHNPANLLGIEVTLKFAIETPQVAVFDTAFHQSMPALAYHYALPKNLYENVGIRRYGFHGTSHYYVAKQAAASLQKPLESLNLITLHLGNGASITAIKQGQCVDTSMGMTPLEGLVMGTRCGDIDPAIPSFLNQNLSMSYTEIDDLLNKESGLKGLCGENDMRAIHHMADADDENAKLALAMFCYRIKKYIGAYYAVLGHVDALVFTGGIGENDAWVREQSCDGLALLGIDIDREKNVRLGDNEMNISKPGKQVAVLVIPTDEELEIAVQSMQCITALQ